jgi:hypothetical protein
VTGTLIDPGMEDQKPPCTCICFDGWSGPTCAQSLIYTDIENQLRVIQQEVFAMQSEMMSQLTVNAEASEEQLEKMMSKLIIFISETVMPKSFKSMDSFVFEVPES